VYDCRVYLPLALLPRVCVFSPFCSCGRALSPIPSPRARSTPTGAPSLLSNLGLFLSRWGRQCRAPKKGRKKEKRERRKKRGKERRGKEGEGKGGKEEERRGRKKGRGRRKGGGGRERRREKEKEENVPRIQEERDPNGGTVEEIKVNNKNLPSYYVYPAQQQNYNIYQVPDRSIATPNWQINW